MLILRCFVLYLCAYLSPLCCEINCGGGGEWATYDDLFENWSMYAKRRHGVFQQDYHSIVRIDSHASRYPAQCHEVCES